MKPADELFAERTRDSFARQPAMQTADTSDDSETKLVATMTATIMTVLGRDGLKH